MGDNKQLPPTVISKNHEETRFSRSLFERLLHCDIEKIMLNEQYRMHPEISQFPSEKFYEGKLKNHFAVYDRKSPLDVEDYPDRVNFFDMPYSKESKDFKSTLNEG